MDLSVDHGFPLVAYSPLLRGFYTDLTQALPKEFDNTYNRERITALKHVLDEIGGITANQLVLAWMRAQKAEIIPIVSGSTIDQIEGNLKASEISLTTAQMDLLNQPGKFGRGTCLCEK